MFADAVVESFCMVALELEVCGHWHALQLGGPFCLLLLLLFELLAVTDIVSMYVTVHAVFLALLLVLFFALLSFLGGFCKEGGGSNS